MKNINDIKLNINATIKDALQIIDSGAIRIAVVVDGNDKLIGTVADGDIRRGLLSGLGFNDSIDTIVFKAPTVCHIDDSKQVILDKAIANKVYQIPIVDADNKLVGIEEVDQLLKPAIKSNKVVLMVGGLGTRLMPLTKDTPKPMLNVGDKPILETIILSFKRYGFVNIILCVNYKSEVIKDYFQDGANFGVNIEYIYEENRMGTAGALSLIEHGLDEDFFVMNGDLLTNINFNSMLSYHLSSDSMATMGVREHDFQVPYGVVSVDGVNIINIEEKPTHSFFVNAGVYILSSKILALIPKNEFYDMPTLFKSIIEQKMPVISFPIHEYWLDVGRIEEFRQANTEYKFLGDNNA